MFNGTETEIHTQVRLKPRGEDVCHHSLAELMSHSSMNSDEMMSYNFMLDSVLCMR